MASRFDFHQLWINKFYTNISETGAILGWHRNLGFSDHLSPTGERLMPLNNRYLVAAVDASGNQIAFVSSTLAWIDKPREAVIFQSQHDANKFIEKNNLTDSSVTNTHELENFDRVQSVFVTVSEQDISYASHNPENPDDVVSHAGICG